MPACRISIRNKNKKINCMNQQLTDSYKMAARALKNTSRLALLGILAIFTCSLAACFKDKGNYDYHTINDIAIAMADTATVKAAETIKVVPTLHQATATDESRLTFEWAVLQVASANADTTTTVLATTRNLEMPITLTASRTPYPVDYKVTDNVTGITYRKRIQLLVTSDYQSGWMLLEQGAAGADISFINPLQGTTFHHAFSAANHGTTLPASTHQLYLFNIPKSGPGANPPFLATTLSTLLFENGGYVLDHLTMKSISPLATLFSPVPTEMKPGFMGMDAPNQIAINNGRLHRRFYNQGEVLFGITYSVTDGSDYWLAPFCGNTNAYRLYFDTLNHRFMGETGGNSLALEPFTSSSSSVANVDPSNVRETPLAMAKYSIYQIYVQGSYALMKSPDNDSCYLFGFSGGSLNMANGVAESPGMAGSPAYAFPFNYKLMYYAAGNELYAYDISANSSKVVYTFDPGENITTLQLQGDNALAVATYNGSGSVYFFNMETNGDVTGGAFANKYGGFDKIVKMVSTEN